jgi:hypothetical protein
MAHGAKGRCWEVRKVKMKRAQGSKLKAIKGWRQKRYNFLFSSSIN